MRFKGTFELHAARALPAGVVGTSICRTVPQGGFATLQDDIAENLLGDHGQRLYVVTRLTPFSRLAYTRYSAVLAQPLHTEFLPAALLRSRAGSRGG